jgi:nitric oxide reductase NorE protein
VSATPASCPPAPKPAAKGHIPGDPSMWFFVIGDLLIFCLYFVSYLFFRRQDPLTFLNSQQHLNQDIGALNTLVLLTSSLLVALGTTAARAGKTGDAFRHFIVAIGCGALFPLLKACEWITAISAGFTPGTNSFFMYYYLLAGMHLCHVLLGLLILCFVTHGLRRSPQPNLRFIETGATYWHMVDLLWVILFALFYVMR